MNFDCKIYFVSKTKIRKTIPSFICSSQESLSVWCKRGCHLLTIFTRTTCIFESSLHICVKPCQCQCQTCANIKSSPHGINSLNRLILKINKILLPKKPLTIVFDCSNTLTSTHIRYSSRETWISVLNWLYFQHSLSKAH